MSSVARLNITNNPLLPILTSLVTETPAGSNVAAEELKEYYLLEKLQIPVFQTSKPKNRKNLEIKENIKLETKLI